MGDGGHKGILDVTDLGTSKQADLQGYLFWQHDPSLGPDLKFCEDILAIQNSQGVEGATKDGDNDWSSGQGAESGMMESVTMNEGQANDTSTKWSNERKWGSTFGQQELWLRWCLSK
jgi:hypothetical protein